MPATHRLRMGEDPVEPTEDHRRLDRAVHTITGQRRRPQVIQIERVVPIERGHMVDDCIEVREAAGVDEASRVEVALHEPMSPVNRQAAGQERIEEFFRDVAGCAVFSNAIVNL